MIAYRLEIVKQTAVGVNANMNKILKAVSKVQELEDITDEQLSKRLGINPGTWSKIKNGLANPGGKVLSALLREFPQSEYPEIYNSVISYMAKPEKQESRS